MEDPHGLPNDLTDKPNYTTMDTTQLYEAMGVDGHKWAEAFRQYAVKLGYSDMDQGWLTGWFCNAMMQMHDHVTGTKTTVLPDGSAFFVGTIGE